eukprot:TRINITY_DN1522_c0_g1_i3.p1 TRINITY_DN1522_c0_g1~~TRINITY_DN1522_c0_g1_i3.p1  ORF type:complete len:218 (+),score=33.58 TRINITY_DN1522_c0_g1_i3:91-744(+)
MIGFISLFELESVEMNPGNESFKLITKGSGTTKEYHLKADTKDEMETWVCNLTMKLNFLKKAIAKKRPTSNSSAIISKSNMLIKLKDVMRKEGILERKIPITGKWIKCWVILVDGNLFVTKNQQKDSDISVKIPLYHCNLKIYDPDEKKNKEKEKEKEKEGKDLNVVKKNVGSDSKKRYRILFPSMLWKRCKTNFTGCNGCRNGRMVHYYIKTTTGY